MIGTKPYAGLLNLRFQPCHVGLQSIDQRALHGLRHRVTAGTLALAVGGLPLHCSKLGRDLRQFGGFVVNALIARNNARLLLVGRQAGLCLFEPGAGGFGLLIEPLRVTPGRLGLERQGDIQVGLRKRIGRRCSGVGIPALVGDVDDIAFPRGPHGQPALQGPRQPCFQIPTALGGLQPSVFDAGCLVELEFPDNLSGNAVTPNDVHLGCHVTGRDHARQHASSDRVRRTQVNQYSRLGCVFFRKQQADCQAAQHAHQKNQHRHLVAGT